MIRVGVGVGSFIAGGYTPTDADALAFVNAAGISDDTQKLAINTLVTDLKGFGIWTKMKAIYPMVGGTASSHRFNLKDPRDLDAAFRLVFSGGWTHSSTGGLPNGTNAFADTKLTQIASGAYNNVHLSYYSRTNILESIIRVEMGYDNGSNFLSLYFNLFLGGVRFYGGSSGNRTARFSNPPNTQGLAINSATSSTLQKIYRNGVEAANTTATQTATASANNILIGCQGSAGGPIAYSNRECAFASIGDGLTDTEAANLYTAVQKYQTTLGRHVGVPIVADSDAQAFLNAAEITNVTQANAVDKLVTDLKGFGIWSKMRAIYPFVGGTASSHRFNLKDPRDLDAAFRLVFSGGITHSSTGVLFNGTNGYADTRLNPSGLLDANNISISTYLRTDTNGVFCDIGGDTSGSSTTYQYSIYARLSNTTFTDLGSQVAGRISYENTDSRGHFISTRTSSTSFKSFRNSTLRATLTTAQTQPLLSRVLFLGAMSSTGFATQFSNRETAFASIGDGLTDTEAANLYTAVQAYQTSLNRQV